MVWLLLLYSRNKCSLTSNEWMRSMFNTISWVKMGDLRVSLRLCWRIVSTILKRTKTKKIKVADPRSLPLAYISFCGKITCSTHLLQKRWKINVKNKISCSGETIFQFPNNSKIIIRLQEKLERKQIKANIAFTFNRTCINIYICIYICNEKSGDLLVYM